MNQNGVAGFYNSAMARYPLNILHLLYRPIIGVYCISSFLSDHKRSMNLCCVAYRFCPLAQQYELLSLRCWPTRL